MTDQDLQWTGLLLEIQTGDHPKRAGRLGLTVYQGGNRLLRREYGRDEPWPSGSSVSFSEPLEAPATPEPLLLVAALEESTEAESDATWDARIRAVLTRSDGRQVEFAGSERFVTGPERPMHLLELSASAPLAP